MYSNTTGDRNIAIGSTAMYNTTAGQGSIAIGYQALKTATTGDDNVAIGSDSPTANAALENLTSGVKNVSVGNNSGVNVTTGDNNTLVGYGAGRDLTTGDQNTIIGYEAGLSTDLTTGSNNTLIGTYARTNSNNASSQIVIGYFIEGSGDQTVTFGNGNGKIYNSFTANATWTQASDERLKKNIVPDTLGLSFINRLETVKYNWKPSNEIDQSLPYYAEKNNRDTTTVMHGLVAQKVKEALEAEGVDTFAGWVEGVDGVQGISREMFISPLIKAIQEQQALIESLTARITALENA